MDPLRYLKLHGDDHCDDVAKRAGTTLAYFKQIAYRHRRPSVDLARALERESKGDLSAVDMLFAELKRPDSSETAVA